MDTNPLGATDLDNRLIDSVSQQELIALLHELGFPATAGQGSSSSIIFSFVGGIRFAIFLVSAKGEPRASAVSFVLLLEDVYVPLAFVNHWNRARYFVKAIVADDGSLALEMNIVLHGVTRAYLQRCLGIWQNALNLLFDELDELEENTSSTNAMAPRDAGVVAPAIGSSGTASLEKRLLANSSTDLSSVERLLSSIDSGIRSMVGNSPGRDLAAIVNRLETVNGTLRDAVSYLRTIASNTG